MKRVITTTMSASGDGDVDQEPQEVEVEATDSNEVAFHFSPRMEEAKSHYFTATDAAIIGYQLIEASENASTWEGPS